MIINWLKHILYRGKYYNEIGKPEQAIKEFDKAIKYQSKLLEAYWWKGYLYLWDLKYLTM